MSHAAPTGDKDAPDGVAARRVARALIGEDPTAAETERWLRAVAQTGLPLERPIDRRLWAVAKRGNPWVGLVDAGLALTDPWSPVRHRIYLMLAVLETSTAHVARFEAREASAVITVAALVARGGFGVLRVIFGVALVRMVGWTAR